MPSLSIQALGVEDQTVVSAIQSFSSWEEFVQVGIEARQHKDKAQWLLGCLSLGIEKKYGQDAIGKYAKTIGMRVATLQTYRWVVKQYLDVNMSFVPPERVSFSVLQSAASLPQDAREKLLERAEIDGLSVEKTRVLVSEQKGKPVRPSFSVQYCALHQKWQFVPVKKEEWEDFHTE